MIRAELKNGVITIPAIGWAFDRGIDGDYIGPLVAGHDPEAKPLVVLILDEEDLQREVADASLERAFRPRDIDDADVRTDSFRASVLRLYDSWDSLPRWMRGLATVLSLRPRKTKRP